MDDLDRRFIERVDLQRREFASSEIDRLGRPFGEVLTPNGGQDEHGNGNESNRLREGE